jgi:hypothetical protein
MARHRAPLWLIGGRRQALELATGAAFAGSWAAKPR